MKDLTQHIEALAANHEFTGVVSVFKGDCALFDRAYGYRDNKNKLPNTAETLFGIASGTKLFTALGIGKLIDQDLLSLQTRIGEIDPNYSDFIDPNATIQQLLSHTSGIYDYYDGEIGQDFDNFFVEIPWYQLETPSDYLPLLAGKSMKFRPGERFSYSNGGYVFLGILIEKLSGRLYRDFVGEHILRAAAMPRSGFHAFNDLPANTANGYLADGKTTNIYHLPLRGGADGGLYTTSAELHRFWHRFFANGILSSELRAALLQTQWAFNQVDGYGCGIYKRLDNSIFSIVGSDAGVGFESRHLVEERITINILANRTGGEAGIGEAILQFLRPRPK